MSTVFFLRLGADPSAPIDWARFVDERLVESGSIDGLAEASSLAPRIGAGDKVVAVMEGEQVAMRVMPAPPRGTAKLQGAARYLLEDELGETVDDLHVAVAVTENRGVALAVKKNLIAEWATRFAGEGVELDVLTPDYLCLPVDAEDAFLLIDHGRIVVKAPGVGAAMDADLARQLLPELLSAAEGANIRAAGGDEAAIASLPLIGVEHLGPLDKPGRLVLLAEGYFAGKPVNLLQGAFRKKRAWGAGVAVWKRPAMIAAGAAAAFVTLAFVEGVQATRVAAMYDESANALHRRAFPDAADKDPRAHAREVLSSGGAAAGFLSISSRVAVAGERAPAVAIDRIRYEGTRNRYVLSVMSASEAEIDAFRRALNANGLATEDSGGYRKSGDTWVGDMIVRPQ